MRTVGKSGWCRECELYEHCDMSRDCGKVASDEDTLLSWWERALDWIAHNL